MKLMKQVKAQYEECLVNLEKAKKEETQQALIKQKAMQEEAQQALIK